MNRLRWLAASWPVVIATLLLLGASFFGASRDFSSFLLSIPILALMLLAAVVAAVWATLVKVERSRGLMAWIIIALSPLAYLCSYGVVQQISFLWWAPTHYSRLSQASKKNGIIIGWDSWGMAGQDTSSYLVVDTQDRLRSNARAVEWTKQIGQSCGIWEMQRVWPRFYIVTTDTNCPYDGVEPAN